MSRKYKRKRLFPKMYSAGYVKVPSTIDKEKIAQYYKRVQTTSGPKDDVEHKYKNTFNRPIIDGVVHQIICDCGGGPFTFQEDYEYHVKKLPKIDHGINLVPDERKHHMDIETGAYIAHALIETEHEVLDDQGDVKIEKARLPKVLVNRRRFEVISTERRTKINELCYIKVGEHKLYFTPTKDRWYFVKTEDDGEYQSRDFINMEHAMLAQRRNLLFWKKC